MENKQNAIRRDLFGSRQSLHLHCAMADESILKSKKTAIPTVKFSDTLVVKKKNIFTRSVKLTLRVGEVTVERRSESKAAERRS